MPDAGTLKPTIHPGDETMREQIGLTRDVVQLSIRELSLDESEMVGGGFGLPHIHWKAIEHKIVANVKSHDFHEIGKDAVFGWGIGSAFGPEGAVIGGLAGADYAALRQDFG
jgi:hypothetical protein